METLQSRYPGVAPFSKGHTDVFFGRENELRSLLRMMEERNQTLLYSKSGIGKTSLIEAGLMHQLGQQSNTIVLGIRFGVYVAPGIDEQPPATPLEILKRRMKQDLVLPTETILDKLTPQHESIWALLKQHQSDENTRYYLIFDQFEELFSYPEEQIIALATELAETLQPYIPRTYQTALQQQFGGEMLLTEEQVYQLYKPFNIRILVAIREDRLSEIDQLVPYLPELRYNFFRLRPLDGIKVRQAITEPAKATGHFASAPFQLEDAAVDRIIDFLTSHGKQRIEMTQLQIICQEIETIRKSWGDASRNIIYVADLPEFNHAMGDFYRSVLAKVRPESQAKTRKFVEESLIYADQRIPVAEAVCINILGRETVTTLVSEHLIRVEDNNSTGAKTYELSHDTLVKPILEMRRERDADEAREQAEVMRLANEAEIEQQKLAIKRKRRQLKVTRIAFGIAFIMVLVAGGFLWAAIDQGKKANKAIAQALETNERLKAKQIELDNNNHQLKVLITQAIDRLVSQARFLANINNKEQAIRNLEEALRLDATRDDIQKEIERLKQ